MTEKNKHVLISGAILLGVLLVLYLYRKRHYVAPNAKNSDDSNADNVPNYLGYNMPGMTIGGSNYSGGNITIGGTTIGGTTNNTNSCCNSSGKKCRDPLLGFFTAPMASVFNTSSYDVTLPDYVSTYVTPPMDSLDLPTPETWHCDCNSVVTKYNCGDIATQEFFCGQKYGGQVMG